MNGIYFIPIFAVVVVGMMTRRVPPIAAKIALLGGILLIACGYFIPAFDKIVQSMNEYHFLGIVFSYLVMMMLVIGEVKPLAEEWVQKEAKAVDMTPWIHSKTLGLILIVAVLSIYVFFADMSVLT